MGVSPEDTEGAPSAWMFGHSEGLIVIEGIIGLGLELRGTPEVHITHSSGAHNPCNLSGGEQQQSPLRPQIYAKPQCDAA